MKSLLFIVAMAQSSSTGSIANLRGEHPPCKKCGRSTNVLVSYSINNPGRIFYCCPEHGFTQWVIEGKINLEIQANSALRQRGARVKTEDFGDRTDQNEAMSGGQGSDGMVQKFQTQAPNWVPNNILWAMTMMNLFSVVANVIMLVLNASRN